jgi:hypothetical protein
VPKPNQRLGYLHEMVLRHTMALRQLVYGDDPVVDHREGHQHPQGKVGVNGQPHQELQKRYLQYRFPGVQERGIRDA